MTRVCIHQPDFLPWLGFFERLVNTDVFIVLDDVSFNRYGWQHRDQIKSANGADWVTVPVKKSGRSGEMIRDVEVQDNFDWRKKHLKTLTACYGRAPFFAEVFERLENIYGLNRERLIDLNMDLITYACDALDVSVDVRTSSSLNVAGQRTEMLVNLTQAAGGNVYVTGLGSRDYLDEQPFNDADISVEWQEFTHPVYPQLHGDFVANLSVVDALMNCGPKARDLIRQ